MNIYKRILKPILFKLDPEYVHDRFTSSGRIFGKSKLLKNAISKLYRYHSNMLEQNICGIRFNNPVGLAAGFDYNGNLTQVLSSVGFGFESVGTVTYSCYEGNTKPRLARLPKSQSILVNKGFKSDGIHKVLNKNLSFWGEDLKVGISIGATNSKECSTPERQIDDIEKSFKYLKDHKILERLAYVELNISCPNVLGSGSLASPRSLEDVLKRIRAIGIAKPLFVKFQLEIAWKDAKELINIMIKYNIDAIILSNLLKNRDEVYFKDRELNMVKELKGNFSGKPTEELSNDLISKVYKEYGDRIKIIGLGGIFNANDAYKKIRLGASLVQLITGMIYEGPSVVKNINKGLEELLMKDGFKNISEAVGIDSK